MQKVFDDLMYQSGLTADGCWDQMDTYDKEAIMKFAELIVRECAEVARLNTRVDSKVYLMIQEHFGVEE